jgi:hypothetical protein
MYIILELNYIAVESSKDGMYFYFIVGVIICIHSVYCVLYCVCSFVCCVSFDRDVILGDVCYLFVVSYCITIATG